MDCARAIVQVGIARLVAIRPNTSDSKWGEQFANAITLLQEAGVKLELSDEAVDSSGGQHD
jgi:deoxycytidylate deaminase